MFSGPQPFKFNLDNGSCANEWQRWLRGFELFVKANRMEEASTKKEWLLHFAGPEVQDVYFNLPKPEEEPIETQRGPLAERYVPFEKDAYQETVDMLEGFFAPKKNITFERHVFRQINQKSNERFDAYVMRLRIQANRCDFGDQLDMSIKDQITSGCSSKTLRRKILQRDGGSLDDTIKMARIIENVSEQQKAFGDNDIKSAINTAGASEAEVCKIENQGKYFRKNQPRQWNPNNSMECRRCGLKGHKASYDKCPAKGKTCNKCGKNDHFAVKCMSRIADKRVSSHKRTDDEPLNKLKREAVQMIENPLMM